MASSTPCASAPLPDEDVPPPPFMENELKTASQLSREQGQKQFSNLVKGLNNGGYVFVGGWFALNEDAVKLLTSYGYHVTKWEIRKIGSMMMKVTLVSVEKPCKEYVADRARKFFKGVFVNAKPDPDLSKPSRCVVM